MRDDLVIFEDAAHRRFLPLTHTRPVYELLFGAMSFRERIERHLRARARLLCRPHMAATLAESCDRQVNGSRVGRRPVVFVNGQVMDPRPLAAKLAARPDVGAWWNGDRLVAARLAPDAAHDLLLTLESNENILEISMLPKLPRHVATSPVIGFPWHLVLQNGERIVADYAELRDRWPGAPDVPPGVHLLGAEILIAGDAVVDPGAVLDARQGPILIGGGVHVAGHTRVEGPAAIGRRSRLLGGRIRGGTTLGTACRVGGEVEASIFHGYSNKYHDGFIGHSYIGEWVNLGALTTNSDLKNTYGPVKVWNDGHLVSTGESKVGALIGDHTKTGIGTLITTGAVIGVAANIFGGGLAASKWVPSFSWGNPPHLKLHDPGRCKATMQVVMERRQRPMTPAYLELIDEVFARTESERAFSGIADQE